MTRIRSMGSALRESSATQLGRLGVEHQLAVICDLDHLLEVLFVACFPHFAVWEVVGNVLADGARVWRKAVAQEASTSQSSSNGPHDRVEACWRDTSSASACSFCKENTA